MTTISLGSQLDALAVLRLMKNDRDEVTEKLAEITEKAERYQEDLQKSVDEGHCLLILIFVSNGLRDIRQ